MREFDELPALGAAMEFFWADDYEAISVGALFEKAGFTAANLVGDSLYRNSGGKEGTTKIVEHELVHHLANPQINDHFDDVSPGNSKGQIAMDEVGILYRIQNRLRARLASYECGVVAK
jgi:hypothetical protein